MYEENIFQNVMQGLFLFSPGETSAPPGADPIAMMEYYMKKAAQEERKRPPKQSKDEMPPPASLQGILTFCSVCTLVYLISIILYPDRCAYTFCGGFSSC